MSKKLIQLIKNSKLIIISGAIASGKSLLLTKLSHYPQLGGTIINSEEQLTSLSLKENVFIDDLSSLDQQDYQQLINNQPKVFFSSQRFLFTSIKIRDRVDLIIKTIGVKQRWWFGWEKYLQLEISCNHLNNYNCEIINLPLTKQDFTRLDAYSKQRLTEYRQTITEQRNSLNNSETRI